MYRWRNFFRDHKVSHIPASFFLPLVSISALPLMSNFAVEAPLAAASSQSWRKFCQGQIMAVV